MRGKTADEVGGLSDQMYAELVRRAPAAPAVPPNNGAATTMPNQDLWLTDPNAAAAQMLAHARATEFAPAFANMANQLGATAREVVKRDYADEFRKYGPEIDLYINQMDPQYRSIDNIVKVVGMVRANHIDEIVAERSQAKLNEMLNSGAVLRPGAAPSGASPASNGAAIDLKNAGLPENYTRVLERFNITPAVLDEFLLKTEVASTGCSLPEARERWVKRAKQGDILTERASGALEV